MINVSVVYSPAEGSFFQTKIELEVGTTVAEALQCIGFYQKFPESQTYAIGIYSKLVTLEHRIESGDRIEIYRPLLIDPKQARRKRAKVKSR